VIIDAYVTDISASNVTYLIMKYMY